MGRPASDRAKDKPRRKTREEGRKEVGVGSQYPDFFRNRDCSKIVRRKPQGGIRRSTGVSRLRPEGPWELSPGFSLGGVTINATSPEGAEEIVI